MVCIYDRLISINGMMATIREAGLMAVAKSKDVPLCIWVVVKIMVPFWVP